MSSALVEGLLESEYTFQCTSLDNLSKTLLVKNTTSTYLSSESRLSLRFNQPRKAKPQ
jgi:hypothetical protein